MAHRPRARARAVVRTLAGRGRGLHDRRAVHAVAADAAAAQRAVDRTAAAGACRPVAGLGPAGIAHVGREYVPDVRQPEQRAVPGASPRPTAVCWPRMPGGGPTPGLRPTPTSRTKTNPKIMP